MTDHKITSTAASTSALAPHERAVSNISLSAIRHNLDRFKIETRSAVVGAGEIPPIAHFVQEALLSMFQQRETAIEDFQFSMPAQALAQQPISELEAIELSGPDIIAIGLMLQTASGLSSTSISVARDEALLNLWQEGYFDGTNLSEKDQTTLREAMIAEIQAVHESRIDRNPDFHISQMPEFMLLDNNVNTPT